LRSPSLPPPQPDLPDFRRNPARLLETLLFLAGALRRHVADRAGNQVSMEPFRSVEAVLRLQVRLP
jgi:hypothetical protein